MHVPTRRSAFSLIFVSVLSGACGGSAQDTDPSCDPTVSDCEPNAPAGAALRSIRLSFLNLNYDVEQPVFVNNSIPIEFGLTATSMAPNQPATRDVSVIFSFVNPDSDDPDSGCSSSATNVELVGDGTEQRFTDRLWPTTQCESIAGDNVIVNLHVAFDPELAEAGVDVPEVLLSEANRDREVNQACRNNSDPNAPRGCVFPIALRPTPVDADGSNLIDVRVSTIELESSVAVLPAEPGDINAQDLRSSLALQSSLVVNGRDPYISLVAPGQIPDELEANAPGIREDLQFGLTPEQLAALSELPGRSRLSYALSAANDQQEFLPLTVDVGEDGVLDRQPSAVVDSLVPGIENTFGHELFIEGPTRTALEPGGQWADESRFVVRACFLADFVQVGNAGEDDVSDCQTTEIFLVREASGPGTGPSRSFDETFDRKLGNPNRISVTTSMEAQNTLNLTGASSHVEGRVDLRGKFGRRFELELARAFATAELKLDEGQSTYDVGVFAFNRRIFTFFRREPTVQHEDPFSASRTFTFPNLGFGFGPVRIGFEVRVGGEITFSPEFEMSVLADRGQCQTFLNSTAALNRCGHISRTTGPEFSLTGSIEGGIDIFIAKAGVEANLNLAVTSFPLTAELVWGLTDDSRLQVRGGARLDLELQLIRGDVSIVGRIGFRRFGRSLKVNLFRFGSKKVTMNLLDRSMADFEELE